MNFEKHGKMFRLEKRDGRHGLALSHYSATLKTWRRMNSVASRNEANRMIEAQYATRTGAFAEPSYWDEPGRKK